MSQPKISNWPIFRFLSLGLIAALFAFTACNDDDDDDMMDDDEEMMNIVELAQSTDNLSTLVDAVVAGGLDDDLSNEDSEFTVFAPSNDAFNSFLSENGYSSLEDIPQDTLIALLQYHVVSGAVMSSELSDGQIATLRTAQESGDSITVSVNGGVTLNGSASVTTADVEATNGVVHIIDEVLLPPSFQMEEPQLDSIVQIVTASDQFSTLESLLTDNPDILSALQGDGPFTVFAPDNDAFDTLFAKDNRFDGPGDLTTEQIQAILQYHVIAGEALASGDLPMDGDSPATLEGSTIAINTSDGVVLNDTVKVRTDNMGAFDIEAANGIIHTIDNVLLPPSLQQPSLAEIITDLGENSDPDGYSIILSILTMPEFSDLLEAAQNRNASLTIFAPDNQAFLDLLSTLGKSELGEIQTSTIRTIVEYHILGQEALSGDLMTQAYSTLNGESVDVTVNGGVMVNDATVEVADQLGANGVIHGIDQVLIPDAIGNTLGTVVEPVVIDTAFTTLRTALEQEELVDDLISADDITVFAPTNTSFQTFINNTDGINSAADLLGLENLSNILLQHVVSTELASSDLPADDADPIYTNTLATGPNMNNLSLKVGPGAQVGAGIAIDLDNVDIQKSNGTIHVIESVLQPQDIIELAVNDGRFGELATALTENQLVETLKGDGPFTVFAPVDAAFEAVYNADNGINEAGDVPADVLLYHVANGNTTSGDLSSGANEVTSLESNGATFTVNVGNDITVDANNSSANVVITDIQGTNGVIHVVDGVLLP